MSTGQISLERRGHVLLIGLDRAAKRNAFDLALWDGLCRAYGELASMEADVLYAGDLTIDRTRATVSRDGRALNLTPTEFRLLVFLAQHPGQVFSRGQLIENVWGSDADFYDDKTVSVHVHRLREKIEHEPGSPELVLTVPGIGYRLAT